MLQPFPFLLFASACSKWLLSIFAILSPHPLTSLPQPYTRFPLSPISSHTPRVPTTFPLYASKLQRDTQAFHNKSLKIYLRWNSQLNARIATCILNNCASLWASKRIRDANARRNKNSPLFSGVLIKRFQAARPIHCNSLAYACPIQDIKCLNSSNSSVPRKQFILIY